jgi:hypothetical protein
MGFVKSLSKILLLIGLTAQLSFAAVIDNIKISGDTISTLDTNGNLVISPNGTGKLEYTPGTASTVPYLDSNKRVTSSAVTPTELGYLSGVTSSIQTQLGTKMTDPMTTNGDTIYRAAGIPARLGIGAADTVYVSNGSAPSWAKLVNANIDAAAAIAYSKLNLSASIALGDLAASSVNSSKIVDDSIVNADVNSAAAIAYSKLNLTGSIVNADVNASAGIVDTKLATISTASKVSNSATTATSANTASAIVARDGSGNFSAGTITAALTGNSSTATALAADPSDCASDTYATTIAASGNLTCATVTNAGLAGSIAASKLVGSDIATVGTITSGTWSGTTVAVNKGGTGITSGTSGGVLAYTASGTIASSGALTANQLVIGGGAGVVPSSLAAGTQYQVLRMGAANPAYGSINLDQSAAVTGTLPVGNGGTGQTSYTDGQLLIGNTSGNTLTKATLTAGANVTITNGNGSISIAASSTATPAYTYVSQSSTLNPAVIGDYYLLSGASFTITLPTAVSIAGQVVIFQHAGTSLTQVYTFNTTSSQTINGGNGAVASGSYKLYTNGETLFLMSDGANWRVIHHETNTGWTNIATTEGTWITATTTAPEYADSASQYARWRRVGSNAEVIWVYRQTATTGSTAGTGNYLFNLPTGLTIDTAVVTANTATGDGAASVDSHVGEFHVATSTTSNGSGPVIVYSTTQLKAMYAGSTNAGSAIAGGAWGSTNNPFNAVAAMAFTIKVLIPISGWQP